MKDWNPALYSRYEDERTRPAAELLARVPLTQPRRVVDLGCGPGNSTELLVARYPDAHVVGTDNSPAMIEAARKRLPESTFELSDIGTWRPDAPVDLIYANASLQWITGHDILFPRLLSSLAPGGVLAVQMPDNREEPTHRLMRSTAADPRFRDTIGPADAVRARMLTAEGYYDLLSPHASVDLWRTTYHHIMGSAADIVEWVRGTGLKPFVEPLSASQQTEFLADYERGIERAYAPRTDGRRLLAFPRIFIVATRAA